MDHVPAKVKTERLYNYFFSYFFNKDDGSAGTGNGCYALPAPMVSYVSLLRMQSRIAKDVKARLLTIMWYQLMSIEDVPEGEMGSMRAFNANMLAAELFGGEEWISR